MSKAWCTSMWSSPPRSEATGRGCSSRWSPLNPPTTRIHQPVPPSPTSLCPHLCSSSQRNDSNTSRLRPTSPSFAPFCHKCGSMPASNFRPVIAAWSARACHASCRRPLPVPDSAPPGHPHLEAFHGVRRAELHPGRLVEEAMHVGAEAEKSTWKASPRISEALHLFQLPQSSLQSNTVLAVGASDGIAQCHQHSTLTSSPLTPVRRLR